MNQVFKEKNKLFVLAFENDAQGTSNKIYYLSNVEIKDYNVMIIGKDFFVQSVRNDKITFGKIRKTQKKPLRWSLFLWKVATGYYTTCCLLDYAYFKDNYKTISTDLSKQQALDVDPRAIQQINFTAKLDRANNTRIFFILEEPKETVLDFSQGTVIVL